MINPAMFINQFVWLHNFVSSDILFLLAFIPLVVMSCFGLAWFLGFGREWRHRNWQSEQSLKGDKRYAEYFKPLKRVK